ncbi:methyl-accepting chemotaxis protein [Orenia marismortui]|uniref:methyl-accepting chemotaxis protein n=1 Tax=Orenia marismortui TaxID=46469 RepID=UPI00035FCA03|nr:methyl-accepting chemotaxis protein [Orenia marismortui]
MYKRLRLREKTLFLVGSLLIITVLIIIMISATKIREQAIDMGKERMINTVRESKSKIKLKFDLPISITRDMASVLRGARESNVNRDAVENMLKSTISEHSNLNGITTVWEVNAYDMRDKEFSNDSFYSASNGRFAFYIVRGKNPSNLLAGPDEISKINWYDAVKENKDTILIEPYRYNGDPLTTVAEPIMVNGEFKGMVGLDVRISFIEEIINEVTDKADMFVLTDEGSILGYNKKRDELSKLITNQKADNKKSDNKDFQDWYDVRLSDIIRNEKEYNEFLSYIKDERTKVMIRDNKIEVLEPIKIANKDLAIWYTMPKKIITKQATFEMYKQLAIGLLLLVISIFILAMFVNKLIKPIIKSKNFANQIADGHLDIDDLSEDNNDEVGDLVSSLNHMKNNLKNMVHNILETVDKLSAYSEELSASSEQGNETIELTIENLKSMISNIEQVSATSQEVAGLSEEANSQTEIGKQNIEKTITNINEINNSVKEAVQVINKLDKTSAKISEIVELINNIAEQTNLLALNAAIEAARAGEHGKGFAVVADEIRELAEETAKSTDNITTLTKDIQNKSYVGLEAIKDVQVKAEEGESIAQETGLVFDQIRGAIQNTSSQVEHTAHISQELNQESEQIMNSSQEITNMSEDITDSAQELTNIAQKLHILVEKFKV